MASPAGEIAHVVQALNDAWTKGRMQELRSLLHVDVVQALPGLRERARGADACVRGYEDFTTSSAIHEFAAEEPIIDLFGTTAVATYFYSIDYEHGGTRWRGTGAEILVLTHDSGEWRIAWRTLIPGAEEEVRS